MTRIQFATYYRIGVLCLARAGYLRAWVCCSLVEVFASLRATEEKCENEGYGNIAWYGMQHGGLVRERLSAYLTLRIPAAISLLSFPMMTGSDMCFCAAAGFCCISWSTWLTIGSPRIAWVSGSAIACAARSLSTSSDEAPVWMARSTRCSPDLQSAWSGSSSSPF